MYNNIRYTFEIIILFKALLLITTLFLKLLNISFYIIK